MNMKSIKNFLGREVTCSNQFVQVIKTLLVLTGTEEIRCYSQVG